MSIFFNNNNEQKNYISEKLYKLYPEFKTGGYFFRKYLKNYIHSNATILDAGCGDNGMISEFKSLSGLIIGIDINENLLNKNNIVDKKIIGNLEQIPLDNNSVDIIVSEFVLEHLQNPITVFKEISRVLKPKGVFIFITPNVLNPIMTLSKILPYSWHKLLRKILLKKREEAHPTYYKANTYGKLLKLARFSMFNNCQISRAGNLEYFGFCKPLVLLAIFFEKIIDNNFLNIFKMYLVGCFVKQ